MIAPPTDTDNGGAVRDARLDALRDAERVLAQAETAALGASRTHDGDRRRARVDDARRAVLTLRAAWRQPSTIAAA